ncbi:beta strand repeat-containing protein [Inquilinus sp.]|jgi:Ca2+-binding RTX toxin-like protein|uniref:beta strand repeat-containing protein n=1 Tax=Inquilinus sp. TaxID=1932117 RepID=UPI0037834D70
MAVVNGTAGKDIIHIAGDGIIVPPGFTDIALATPSRDMILAGAGDDIVTAGTGGDYIDGGVGVDTLLGREGDDTLIGGDGNDILTGGAGADFLLGGAGVDTVSYAGAAATNGIGIGVQIGVGSIFGNGDDAGDVISADVENLIGSAFLDLLIGSDGANTLNGGGGNDRLEGNGGADHLIGGDGIDTVSYFNSLGSVTVNLATQAASGGDAQGDVLDSFESAMGGAGSDTLIGSAGDNSLDGSSGDDVVRGGAGRDTLTGGQGNDLLRGGAGADFLSSASSSGDSGIDTVTYSDSTGGVTVSLAAGTGSGADAEGDVLDVFTIENLNGSAFGDGLEGSTIANVLRGLAGNDEISGGGGDDTLVGGTGADHLFGGAGIDTAAYDDSSAGVVASLAAGSGSGNAAQGDTFSGVENLTGSQGADRLTGDGGANVLRGVGGNDILAGGFGADVLDGGAGADLVTFFGATQAVDVNLTLGRGAGGDAQGDTYASIENANGGKGGDFLIGGAGANVLNGFEGNDVLDGRAGRDMLGGGIGADRFAFISVGDSVVGANADRITDFSRAHGDKIDLSGIDASTKAAGNQAFSFIGTALYHHVAGELRFAQSGGTTTIAGDVNGDGTSDFQIVLTGTVALTAADFVL